jgi:hypothetical protein
MTANSSKTTAVRFWNNLRRFGGRAAAGLFLLSAASAPAALGQTWELTQVYGNSAGLIGQLAMTTLKSNVVVTAVTNSTNNLEVIAWNDTGTKLARTGSATGDEVFPLWGVAITALDSSRVVTAAANWNTSDLELTVWKISPSGSVAQQGKIGTGGVVTEVSIAMLDSGRVVTAVQNSEGGLTLRVWEISSTGVITAENTYSVSSASEMAVMALNPSQVVTAYRNGKENLELIAFSIDGSNKITRQGTVTSGAVAKISMGYWPPNIVTAVETEKAGLDLQTWSVDASGDIASVLSASGGSAFAVSLAMVPTAPDTPLPFTLVETSKDDLSLVAWYMNPEYEGDIGEMAYYNGGSYIGPQLAIASEGPGRPYFVVTAVKNTSSDLEMKVWQLYQPTE